MTRRSASLNAAASEPPAARPPSSSGAPWLPTNSPVTVRAPFAQHTPAPTLIKHDLRHTDCRDLLHLCPGGHSSGLAGRRRPGQPSAVKHMSAGSHLARFSASLETVE